MTRIGNTPPPSSHGIPPKEPSKELKEESTSISAVSLPVIKNVGNQLVQSAKVNRPAPPRSSQKASSELKDLSNKVTKAASELI